MIESHHSRWHDTRAMLTSLLAWLDATQQWVETTVPDPDAQPAPDRLPSDLGPATSTAAPGFETELEPEAETITSPDLFALLAAMTALRQEVKLQTRSARSDREQSAQTLDQLSAVVAEIVQPDQIEDAQPDHVAVDSLVELHDALSRAERQGRLLMTETVTTLRDWGRHATPPDEPSEQNDTCASQLPEPQPRRWFKRRRRDPIPAPNPTPDPEAAQPSADWRQIGADAEHIAHRLEGLSAGYSLGLQRLERLLAKCAIEPIDCVGNPVDAELMEVVQLVTESGQPDGVVVDEVRRGYRRGGQVYRFAQVVVAQMRRPEAEPPLTEDYNTQQEVD